MMPVVSARKQTMVGGSRGIVPVVVMAWVLAGCVHADAARPLAPPDLSSPRACLMNFMALMSDAHRHWMSDSSAEAERLEREAINRVAHQFFDLSDVAPAVRRNVGRETAVYLKEVLDRVDLPQPQDIPDAQAAAAMHLSQWTIPQTEITLVRVKDGLREGQWIFSSQTDERASEFYDLVKRLPYKAGATEGLYESFMSEPGWMIPRGLIRSLPNWMQGRHAGQAIWQWCALVLTLIATTALIALIFRATSRWSRDRGTRYYVAASFPVFAVLVPQAATDFLSDQVFITGRLFVIVDFALDLVSLAAFVALILILTNRIAAALKAFPWSAERKLTAQLAQMSVRAVGGAGALIAVFEGGRYLGVPLTTLVAGVSVSGLTVALAAQDTLKNLFGSLMILLDRPFQVGDLIRIKGHEGRVETVGLRSTRIRDVNGHVVSISNDEMARLDSKNISNRDHLRRHEVLRLRADTPASTIRDFAAFVRTLLAGREGLDPNVPPKVRIGFGDDAVTFTMTYHSASRDTEAFAALDEEITLLILERMAELHIRFAPATHRSGEPSESSPIRSSAPQPHAAHGVHPHHAPDHDASPHHAQSEPDGGSPHAA